MQKYKWQDGQLAKVWNYESDWKPMPNSAKPAGWEPVYHAAMTASAVFVPGGGGSVVQLDRNTGAEVRRFTTLGAQDPNAYVAGPLTIDAAGNVLFNVVKLDHTRPWSSDIQGAWLVRARPADGGVQAASYPLSLLTSAPNRWSIS